MADPLANFSLFKDVINRHGSYDEDTGIYTTSLNLADGWSVDRSLDFNLSTDENIRYKETSVYKNEDGRSHEISFAPSVNYGKNLIGYAVSSMMIPASALGISPGQRMLSAIPLFSEIIYTREGKDVNDQEYIDFVLRNLHANNIEPGPNEVIKTRNGNGYIMGDDGKMKLHEASSEKNIDEGNSGDLVSEKIEKINSKKSTKSITREEETDYLRKITGIADDEDLGNIKTIFRKNRFDLSGDTIDPYIKGYGYLFMTRPDCNFMIDSVSFNSMNLDSVDPGDGMSAYDHYAGRMNTLQRMIGLDAVRDPGFVSSNLSYSTLSDHMNPYIQILTNRVSNFGGFDSSLLVADNAFETRSGYKRPYGQSKKEGRISGQFSVTYNETANLDISSLHNVWVNYIDASKLGYVPRAPLSKMVALDYLSSAYIIMTEPDGETITYWAKFTGIFPVSVPWSTIGSFQRGSIEIPEIEINYHYTYREEMDVEILRDIQHIYNGFGSGEDYFTAREFLTSRSGIEDPSKVISANNIAIMKETDQFGKNKFKLIFTSPEANITRETNERITPDEVLKKARERVANSKY